MVSKHDRQVEELAIKVRFLALVVLGIMIVVDQSNGVESNIDLWLYGVVAGIAIGAKTDDFIGLLPGKRK